MMTQTQTPSSLKDSPYIWDSSFAISIQTLQTKSTHLPLPLLCVHVSGWMTAVLLL